MRRRYAFEAEELAPEVKAQLEKVEDVVEDKCSTPDACNKMLEKIDAETEKFNGALKDMAGAAKDCKDGKCDKAEMAAQISPKMAELKEVAKSIGVASEGENLTEDELKKAKAYLEGAKEIVEAKLDEVDSESGKEEPKDNPDEEGDEKGDHEEPDGDEEEAEEAFYYEDAEELDNANEAYLDSLDYALESFCFEAAMEGSTVDSVVATIKKTIAIFRGPRKEMKAAAKKHDYATAADKAKECASVADDLISELNGLDQSVSGAVLVDLALMIIACFGVGMAFKGMSAAAGAIGGAVGKAGGYAKGAAGAKAGAKALGKEMAEIGGAEYGKDVAKNAIREAGAAGAKAGAEHGAAIAKNPLAAAGRKAGGAVGTVVGAVSGKKETARVGKALADAMTGDELKETAALAGKQQAERIASAAASKGAKAGIAAQKGIKGATMAAGAGGVAIAVAKPNVVKVLENRKAMKADGTVEKAKLQPNDFNALISAMKLDARKLKEHYLKLAAQYEKMASAASESDASGMDFDSFIAACESIAGETFSRESSNAPYLFD